MRSPKTTGAKNCDGAQKRKSPRFKLSGDTLARSLVDQKRLLHGPKNNFILWLVYVSLYV